MQPELTDNWTRHPNHFWDNVDQFSLAAIAVYGFMCRKNFGWDAPNCQFSINYLSSKMKLSRSTVIKAVDELVEKGQIKQVGTGQRGIKLFIVCVPTSLENRLDVVQNLDHSRETSLENRLELVYNTDQNQSKKQTKYKKPIVKQTNININHIIEENNFEAGKVYELNGVRFLYTAEGKKLKATKRKYGKYEYDDYTNEEVAI